MKVSPDVPSDTLRSVALVVLFVCWFVSKRSATKLSMVIFRILGVTV